MIKVDTSNEKTECSGFECERGREYATEEATNPERTVTTTIRVSGGQHPLVSVKTSKPIPKNKIKQLMKELAKTTAQAPIKQGDTIQKNILNTQANITATNNNKKSTAT